MIIEVDKDATILDRKADALVMVVDSSGRDITGLLRNWLDISQVIEMMALCKELTPGKVINFELEKAHLFVITDSDVASSMMQVFEMMSSLDISSINVPDIDDIANVVWGMEHAHEITVRLCRA